MSVENRLEELESYVSKTIAQIRSEMGLPKKPGDSIGLSFDTSFALAQIPENLTSHCGYYQSKTNEALHLEVLEVNSASKVAICQILYSDGSVSEKANISLLILEEFFNKQ